MTKTALGLPDLRAEAGPLFSFISARVGERTLAEDLTQETFMAALQSVHDPERGTVRAWLFGIAIRKIADHQRSRRIRKDHLAAVAREMAIRMVREPLPGEWLDRREVRDLVNEALSRMEESAATLLVRKYFDGASVAELAEEFGVSGKALESQLTRARLSFHEIIERFSHDG